MHRVDTATAIAALPALNPAGTPGFFSQGAATGSPPATVPGQDWFNSAQEELVSPILAEGLALSKSDNSQLYQAIRRIAARSSGGMSNVNFASSVSASALTNELKGLNGADPSPTNPVDVVFRSTTITNSAVVLRTLTSPKTIVVPTGATLGFTANEVGYVYKYLVDIGGAQQLGVSKKAIFDESKLHDTSALGSGADSDNVLYTQNPFAGAAVRLIGRELIQTGAIAGSWSNAPTRREVWTPAMKSALTHIAQFSNASNTTLAVVAAPNSGNPIHLEVGDLITVTWTGECQRNGADFAALGRYPLSGSAILESTPIANGPSDFHFEMLGIAAFGAGFIYKSQTVTKRVVSAGTFTGFNAVSTAFYGTTPIGQRGHLSVSVVRPNY